MSPLLLEPIEIPGAPLGPENPLPFFRDKAVNLQVPIRETVESDKRDHFGYASAHRILPYRMQDSYTRARRPYHMQTAVLENELLKATFWIELGCRMMSLVYKPLQRELLFNNPVFQPANLAIRNAWFAGGVEWNVGQYGHTFFTCAPLFVARIPGLEGEDGMRIYEYERCKNIFWHTDFYLPPRSPYLIVFTRVINAQDEDTSLYWWSNMAVPETADVRVLAPTDQSLYIDGEIHGFGQANPTTLPSYHGKDATYPVSAANANEFFFQCQTADVPWEAALDRNGEGLIEASTPQLGVRKLFCWGMHQGGRHWQEFLSVPGMAYAETQAGLAPTQLHSLPFEAGDRRSWTEVYGYMKADPQKVHGSDWEAAWRTVDTALKAQLTAGDLANLETRCLERADAPSYDILQRGSGWGALELARKAVQKDGYAVPDTFVFPAESMGEEQQKWLALLEKGQLPTQSPQDIPGDWMVQRQWRELLAKSQASERPQDWFTLLHYGVMLAEAFDEPAAVAAWEQSIALAPSPWAYRNLATLAHTTGKMKEAIWLYQKAADLMISVPDGLAAFAQEYLSVLCEAEYDETAWEFCNQLPAQALDFDPVQILRARIALAVGRLDEAEAALHREYASVREGAVTLTDLWVDLWRKKIAALTGRSPEDISPQEIRRDHPAPAAIDFRSAE